MKLCNGYGKANPTLADLTLVYEKCDGRGYHYGPSEKMRNSDSIIDVILIAIIVAVALWIARIVT